MIPLSTQLQNRPFHINDIIITIITAKDKFFLSLISPASSWLHNLLIYSRESSLHMKSDRIRVVLRHFLEPIWQTWPWLRRWSTFRYSLWNKLNPSRPSSSCTCMLSIYPLSSISICFTCSSTIRVIPGPCLKWHSLHLILSYQNFLCF